MLSLQSISTEETERLGRLLGTFIETGTCVALYGDLGGGKTCFTRGLVSSIAPLNAHLVTSPTFAIMQEYQDKTPVYHFDFYRLSGSGDIFDMGFDEYFTSNGVCIIEWAERLDNLLPEDTITVHFEYVDDSCRILRFDATGFKSKKTIQLFQAAMNM